MRQAILDVARECLDTPFRHQGRLPGVGLDCVGLIRHPAVVVGILDNSIDAYGYPRHPNPEQMESILLTYFDRISRAEMLPGDILWLKAPQAQHLALYAGDTIIHAVATQPLKVVEHGFRHPFTNHVCGVFRFRGIV